MTQRVAGGSCFCGVVRMSFLYEIPLHTLLKDFLNKKVNLLRIRSFFCSFAQNNNNTIWERF